MKITQLNNGFIKVTEASTGYEYRINPNYIVSYRETDSRRKEDFGYSAITCKSSMGTDISVMYIMETCEYLDQRLTTKFILEKETDNDSINSIH